MKTLPETIEMLAEWAEDLENDALPHDLAHAKSQCLLPERLGRLPVTLGIREWPHGAEHRLKAHLAQQLREVLVKGASVLGKPLLPLRPEEPFDVLRAHHGHEWSGPLDLDIPLWLALANGCSRHFGIEFKLTVQINAKWGVASEPTLTPRQLLAAFGFDPAEFSLYVEHSADLLPPDQPLSLKRGDRFEAQRDGKYGLRPPPPRGLQTLEQDLEALEAARVHVRMIQFNNQTYIEVKDLQIASPPWSGPQANILIAAPSTYPAGGLDAFYLETTITQGGSILQQQGTVTIGGRQWALISWHYADGHPWNPTRDDLASHIAHCRGFFLQRGVQ